ncbi:MAG: 16S rRNA (adenine(1518)-N(6)/adenine(1519)-N(6))-dimethyltransferase RsmA [Candidatus Bathyarchaeota archaeon]|nr:16S rRNA (adenine(1518)-N(6)/adenine(1519)-N(6))-dimethyltransferase RsmA [Candidatus Bathyarchaeota archaeon]MDW8039933.1 16S rRNA (adenine(1518)-N(6)/adenine(1519)-N(6))-dimethyltransferase RsmA [Nitrososphaerota archaeon]
MSLLEETKFLLRRYRIRPKKRLGQHFTIDSSFFQRMAEYASLTREDIALDVGAGLGFLTRFLAGKCKEVLAVEADSRLASILREILKAFPNVLVLEGDLFKVQLPWFNKVVAIPPYGISSMLVRWLFDKRVDCAVLVFQKEFAYRLVAPIGSKDYGWLTVLTYYHFDVELLDEIPRWTFFPQPKVDSVIVQFKPRRPPFHVKNEKTFTQLVQTLFTQRNKKVKNAIQAFIKRGQAKLTDCSIPFQGRRVRELAPEDFGVLADVIAS